MKKIKSNHNPKDRIVCVTDSCGYKLYYQPFGSNDYIWLLNINGYSPSISEYFRANGTRNANGDFSLTINQLYELKKYRRNFKITKMLERLPAQVEYAIRESLVVKAEVKSYIESYEITHNQLSYDGFEYAA